MSILRQNSSTNKSKKRCKEETLEKSMISNMMIDSILSCKDMKCLSQIYFHNFHNYENYSIQRHRQTLSKIQRKSRKMDCRGQQKIRSHLHHWDMAKWRETERVDCCKTLTGGSLESSRLTRCRYSFQMRWALSIRLKEVANCRWYSEEIWYWLGIRPLEMGSTTLPG